MVLCDHIEEWDREGGREGDARGKKYGDGLVDTGQGKGKLG